VAVDITGAGEVAAFEIETQFDGELLRFVDGHAGEFLASTGRAVVQLGPMRDGSSVSLGAFSLPGAPAPSGGGRLVELRFEVLGTGDAVVEVTRAATVDPMNVTTIVGGAAITIAAGESPPPASSSYVPLVIDR
ncbi:MAG: cohesin domain-containing protein, partial [Anaerolineae bacterium]